MPRVIITSVDTGIESQLRFQGRDIITWFDSNAHALDEKSILKWQSPKSLCDSNDESLEILKVGDAYVNIPISEIVRIEQITCDTNIILSNQQYISSSLSINNLEDNLSKHRFIRIHPNHLVNVKHLNSFVRCNAFVTLSNSDAIPVAVGNDKKITDFLDNQSII